MNILLSCFAFRPGVGSEPGVGWNFALTLTRAGHRVVVLTVPNSREAIEAEQTKDTSAALISVTYTGLPGGRRIYANRLLLQVYYIQWQIAAFFVARGLCRDHPFDLIHVLTTSGIRFPSFLGLLGLPMMIGPLGGGETMPRSLLGTLRVRHRLIERLRMLTTAVLRYDPLMMTTFATADVILARTKDTAEAIDRRFRRKIRVCFGIGVEESSLLAAPRAGNRSAKGHFDVLFVARLVYWKGGVLALRAFGRLAEKVPEAHLTIVGRGPESGGLRALVADLGLTDKVTWREDWLSSQDLERIYEQSQVLLFPSLHEAGGTVVLEALAKAMPVICLDIGGPGQIVSPQVGNAIKTAGVSPAEVVNGLSDALTALALNATLYASQSANALQEARARSWAGEVDRVYRHFFDLRGKKQSGMAAAVVRGMENSGGERRSVR